MLVCVLLWAVPICAGERGDGHAGRCSGQHHAAHRGEGQGSAITHSLTGKELSPAGMELAEMLLPTDLMLLPTGQMLLPTGGSGP